MSKHSSLKSAVAKAASMKGSTKGKKTLSQQAHDSSKNVADVVAEAEAMQIEAENAHGKAKKGKKVKTTPKEETVPVENPVIGKDSLGQDLHIGDVVNHTQKPFQNGTIVSIERPIETPSGIENVKCEYKGEPACIVQFPMIGSHLSRFSRLVRATQQTVIH